jgi:hypothetical protein
VCTAEIERARTVFAAHRDEIVVRPPSRPASIGTLAAEIVEAFDGG